MTLRIFSLLFLLFLLTCSGLTGQIEKEDGPVKIYYPNGQVSSEGMVRDGKPDGYWKTYYVTGVLKSEGKRTNFLLDSTWRFYNQLGELTEVINYQLGKRSGYTLKYTYDNPNKPGDKTLISKELYINDRKEGTSEYYYNTGELKEEIYYIAGKRSGASKQYDKDGTVTTFLQYKDNYLVNRERINRKDEEGRKQGTHREYFEDGDVKLEVNYLDDQLHGYYREYDEEGNLVQSLRYERGAVVEEIDEEARELIDFKRTFDEEGRLIFSGGYIDEVPIGIHRFFDTTGTVVNSYVYNEQGTRIAEGIVDEQGIRRGAWTDYYLTGEVKAKGNYRDNRKSGRWVYYFRNGRVEQEGNYLRGRFDGEWTWYYEDGNVWRTESFFNGQEDGYLTEYDPGGKVITEGNYISGERDGEWFYTMGDHTEKGRYIIGLREGQWEYYYNDGSIKFVGNYLQGMPDGRQVYYYPDGDIKEEQYYERGIREKTWRKYDENGNVFIAISYRDNNEIRVNGIKIRLPESDIKVIQ